MATLREIKRRISSIKSTQQITRAMKMVAAAKLRRAQENIFAARPYAYKIDELIQHLVARIEEPTDPLLASREPERMMLVVVTADRGLCGSFNSNIIRKATQEAHRYRDRSVTIVCVGRKGYDFFRKRDYQLGREFIHLFNNLQYPHAQEIAQYLIEEFLAGRADRVLLVYNEFKSVIQQNLKVEQFLPLKREAFEAKDKRNRVDYIYEPSQEALLRALLPKHLNMQVWRVLLESYAAEQGARMAAMENATENAGELIHDLTLLYNKARQAAITKEISEIVGGAEALKSAS